MAAGQYKYDSEGAQFLTFLLTFLLIALLPLTYSVLGSTSSTKKRGGKQGDFDAKGQKVDEIKRIHKRSLFNPKLSKRVLFVLLGWSAVGYLAHRIANTVSTSSHAVYDPFQILGLAAGATEKEIKKHYKKLSIKFHPDKIQLAENQTKEEVESQFIDLTKAYKSLTDETIRKNFELYGHPDGRQEMSMGIALPEWVIESQNNVWVLGAYGLVFGLGLPYLVARWWYGSRSRTKDGLINATAQSFFQHLREDTPPARILALVAISEELQDPILNKRGQGPREKELQRLEAEVRETLKGFGERWQLIEKFRSESIRKTLVLLYAYLFRIETSDKTLTRDRYVIGAKAEKLLNGMLQIALAHNWMDLTILLMDMLQCIVQAVPPSPENRPISELLQLPHVTSDLARAIVASDDKLGPLGLQGFWNLPEARRRKVLSTLDDGKYKETIKTLGQFPRIELVDAYFKVTGEKIVTMGAIVQLVIKVRTLPFQRDSTVLFEGVRPGSDAARRDEESDVRPSGEDDAEAKLDHLIGRGDRNGGADADGKQAIGFARAPYFVEDRKPSWWVMLGDLKQSRVIVQPTKVTDVGPDKVRTYSVQFQAPPQVGMYTFVAMVKSDSYLGSEAQMSVKLKIEDPSALEESDVEDDISEPDEDTLAGQMAMMRGDKVKAARSGDDDEESGTDDDEEGEEEDSESDWE